MAQQNQRMAMEFPPKRKRGRPRKYDAPQSEPYGQYRPPQPNVSIYNDRILSLSAPRNLHRTPNIRLPASVSRDGPPQGLEIPNEAGPAGISRLKSHSSLVPHINFQTSASGSRATQTQPNAQSNAGFPTDVVSRSHLNQDKPAQVDVVASSGASRQFNRQGSSIQGPYSLKGQTVSGTLDDAIGGGYLLTVQVAGTGVVLKGMVFDTQFSVPLRGEIDIGPAVPVGNASSVSEALNLEPICSPTLSAFKLETATAPQKKVAPPFYPVSHRSDSMLPEIAPDSANNFRGISYFYIGKSLEGPDTTLKLAVTKETSQFQLDETKIPNESSRIDKDKMEIEKSFKDIVEASQENVDDFETVESSRDIKVSEEDQGQKGNEVLSLKTMLKEPDNKVDLLKTINFTGITTKESEQDEGHIQVQVSSSGMTPQLCLQAPGQSNALPEECHIDLAEQEMAS